METCDKKHDRVGIINLQWVDNYGAVLLAYALQTVIERLGYSAENIDYRPVPEQSEQNPVRIINHIIKNQSFMGITRTVWRKLCQKLKAKQRKKCNQEKGACFERFRCRYLKRSTVFHTITARDPLEYDIYVVGSDVVWKPERILSSQSDVYLLDFASGKACRCVAYAASIGTDDEEKLHRITDRMERSIRGFDAISLREKTSIPFIRSIYRGDVSWCIDPTLLLQSKDYDILLDQSLENDENRIAHYIYLYMFEENDEIFDMVSKYARSRNLAIVSPCLAHQKKGIADLDSSCDGPVEFLRRVKNADLVITDSFHGTVFSIIYRKEFFTLGRGKLSVRMRDFLKRLSLEDRYCEKPTGSYLSPGPIDYMYVEREIGSWRELSIKYLKNAIAGRI